jgi:hypothetical protein
VLRLLRVGLWCGARVAVGAGEWPGELERTVCARGLEEELRPGAGGWWAAAAARVGSSCCVAWDLVVLRAEAGARRGAGARSSGAVAMEAGKRVVAEGMGEQQWWPGRFACCEEVRAWACGVGHEQNPGGRAAGRERCGRR